MSFIEISTLSRSEFKNISKIFTCQENKLLEYIRQFAYNHSSKGLFKTYLFKSNKKYAGFISFSNSIIEAQNIDLNINIYYPLPALKITRLCVFEEYQNKGIGNLFLTFAYVMGFIQQQKTGCKVLLVDSKKEAKEFYLKNDFIELNSFNDENNYISMFKQIFTTKENKEQIKFLFEFAKLYDLEDEFNFLRKFS